MASSDTYENRTAVASSAALQFACFVCFIATVPIYSPNIVALNYLLVADVTTVFARTVLASSLVGALVLCALSIVQAKKDFTQFALKPSQLVGAAIIYFLGCAGYIALIMAGLTGTLTDVLGFICAAMAGLSLMPICVHWASIVRSYELRHLILFSVLGFLFAAAINLGLQLLPAPWLYLVHIAFLGIAAFTPLLLRSPVKEPPSGQVCAPQLGSYCSVMGVSLIGIAISSFVIGIAPTTVFDDLLDTQAVGAILVGLIAVPFCLWRTKTPTNILVQRVAAPIAAVVALAVCAFPYFGTEVKVIASYTLLSLVGSIALGTATAISNAHEFPRAFVFATLVGTYALAALAGLAVGFFLSQATEFHSTLVIVLAVLYCVLTVCVSCVSALSKNVVSPAIDTGSGATVPQPSVIDLQIAIDRICERFGLTPRESEIFGILAHGHGCAYIADTLLISKNTVYTHVRNLYRKMEISGHEELIQLVDRERHV